MNANTLIAKEYISSNDVFDAKGKPITLSATIAGVTQVLVGQEGEREQKWALSFAGTERKLTLNKTNIGALIEFFGAETDDWKGQTVSLIGAYTEYQGKTVKAIRIRPPVDGAPRLDADKSFDPEEIPF